MAQLTPACAVCGTSLHDLRPQWVKAHRRTPEKLYCGKRCIKRAAYVRRKERLASVPVLIADPLEAAADGWPFSQFCPTRQFRT